MYIFRLKYTLNKISKAVKNNTKHMLHMVHVINRVFKKFGNGH